MKLDPVKHRIVRYLAQQFAAQRPDVSEGTLAVSLGIEPDEMRRHVDELEGVLVSVEKRLQNQNRWLRLSRDGEDYAHKHGII
ncbi:MAG: hypothetical protein ABIG03_01200 [Candidatus Eisenbacteria bacterium]